MKRARQVVVTIGVGLGWPAILLALGYFGYTAAVEISAKCEPLVNRRGLWGTFAVLSGTLFGLTALRVFAGRSPWLPLEVLRFVLLCCALLWVSASGVTAILLAYAFSESDLGRLADTWVATPAILPVVQTLGALVLLGSTKRRDPKYRLIHLALITLGLPVLWIASVEAVAVAVC